MSTSLMDDGSVVGFVPLEFSLVASFLILKFIWVFAAFPLENDDDKPTDDFRLEDIVKAHC